MARLWIWMMESLVLLARRLIYAVGSSTAPRLSKSPRYFHMPRATDAVTHASKYPCLYRHLKQITR